MQRNKATVGTLSALLVAAVFGGVMWGANPVQAGEAPAVKPCDMTSFKTKEVEAACKKGGKAEAKKLMKSVVKKAKAAGESVKCTSCHGKKDGKPILKDGAVEGLKKWLAAK